MPLKIYVGKYFFCLLQRGLQFARNFLSTEKVILVAENLKLVFKIADLVIAEARERLKLARSKYFVTHSNKW